MGLARRGGARGRGWEAERERGEGEAVCCTTRSRSTTTGWLLKGGGLSRGAAQYLCVGGGGGQEERQRRRESYPGTPGAICHIGMALELPGGPPHSRRVFRSWSGEQGGAWSSREWSEVMAYSSSGGASVSWAGGRVVREEGGLKGGGRKASACQGSVFLGMLVKPAGEISV